MGKQALRLLTSFHRCARKVRERGYDYGADMAQTPVKRPTWKEVLAREKLLQLPAAHDALTARLIEQAGFPAYQIGGFALCGARFGDPDLDLEQYAEKRAGVRDIIAASPLPVLVDADDGYGDVKNVTRTVRGYESLGVSALFIEDQTAPKRCGHMAGKEVVPAEMHADRIRAAAAARSHPDALFLVARTDALEARGIEEALRRCELYIKAGADAIYVEGPGNRKQLEQIGQSFKGVPKAMDILEGGGETPWYPPSELKEIGFSMILYPTTVLFRMTYAIQQALKDLRAGRKMDEGEAVNMRQFEQIVDMPYWSSVESKFGGGK